MAKKNKVTGDRLKAIRKKLNLTQGGLGEKLGMHQASVAMIENGTNSLSNQVRKGLIDIFGVNPNYIDKGASPIILPEKKTQKNSTSKDSQELLEKISQLEQIIADKNKIISLYESMKGKSNQPLKKG